ncbi:hypothetical protein [Plebeiibacterium sediminum]|uniref:Uncharacterized protein n=1 Tax=Plebeiibacterium sediminum TaxID=2992112 RepID=A0AAE3MAD3_9BACT|nr:hypothetical protein [Plebeiobacterium sediminum]MCW3789774.1 hypothetical protein [Plebeiobacterium sediminum]
MKLNYKKTIKIISIIGITGIGIFFTIKIVIFLLFAKNYMDDKSPEYLDYVANRIGFTTTNIESLSQKEIIFERIDSFLIDNSEYCVPSGIQIQPLICSGCTTKEILVYFSEKPIEIYRITFEMTGGYIDEIYTLKDNEFIEYKTEKLEDKEKERISNRVKEEVLDKIDWELE